MKIEAEEAPKKTWTRLRTDWFILTADFWLDETALPTCEKVDSRLWLDEKISVWVFHATDSIGNLSKYEINDWSSQLFKPTEGLATLWVNHIFMTWLKRKNTEDLRFTFSWHDLKEKNTKDLRSTFSINLKFDEKKRRKVAKNFLFARIDIFFYWFVVKNSHGSKFREISLHPGLYCYRNVIRHGQRSFQSRSWTVPLALATAPLANTPIRPGKSVICMVSKEYRGKCWKSKYRRTKVSSQSRTISVVKFLFLIVQSAERKKDGNKVNQISDIFIGMKVVFISSVYPLSAVGTKRAEITQLSWFYCRLRIAIEWVFSWDL